MRLTRLSLTVLALIVLTVSMSGGAVVALMLNAAVQDLERPSRPTQNKRYPTKSWHVATLPEAKSYGSGYPPARVDVIDTEGVCLYVVRNWATGEGNSPAMVAVPKTMLPPSTGCQ